MIIRKSFLARLKGLMFNFKIEPTLIVLSKDNRVGIHTWFVFFPIIVYWLNSDGIVVKKRKMRPFSIDSGCRARYVLEMPIKSKEYNLGDIVKL